MMMLDVDGWCRSAQADPTFFTMVRRWTRTKSEPCTKRRLTYTKASAGYTEAYVNVIRDRLVEVGVPEEGRDYTFTDDGDLIVTAPGHRVVFREVIHPDLDELSRIEDADN